VRRPVSAPHHPPADLFAAVVRVPLRGPGTGRPAPLAAAGAAGHHGPVGQPARLLPHRPRPRRLPPARRSLGRRAQHPHPPLPRPGPPAAPARTSLFGSLVPVWRDPRCRALALCLAASVLATLANPYGWKVYLYVRTTSIAASSRHIDEWVPPGLNLMVGRVWVLSILLLLVLFALPQRRPTSREVCLLLCFLPLACGSVRMVSWWLLIAAPIAAGLLADNLPRQLLDNAENERPSWGAAGFFALLVLGIVLCIPGLEGINPVLNSVRSPHRDEEDLQAVAEHLLQTDGQRPGTRRVFSRFEWGEYLGWS